jgi:hypothetical protein
MFISASTLVDAGSRLARSTTVHRRGRQAIAHLHRDGLRRLGMTTGTAAAMILGDLVAERETRGRSSSTLAGSSRRRSRRWCRKAPTMRNG